MRYIFYACRGLFFLLIYYYFESLKMIVAAVTKTAAQCLLNRFPLHRDEIY